MARFQERVCGIAPCVSQLILLKVTSLSEKQVAFYQSFALFLNYFNDVEAPFYQQTSLCGIAAAVITIALPVF